MTQTVNCLLSLDHRWVIEDYILFLFEKILGDYDKVIVKLEMCHNMETLNTFCGSQAVLSIFSFPFGAEGHVTRLEQQLNDRQIDLFL